MSKKTIALTMTATGRRPRERKQVVLDGLTGESVPFAANEQNLRDVGSESRSDEWAGDSARDAEPSRIPDPRPAFPRLGGRRKHDDRSAGRTEPYGSDGVERHAAVRARMVLVGQCDRLAPAHFCLGRLRRRKRSADSLNALRTFD